MRLFAFFLPFTALSGCILYDSNGKCHECGPDELQEDTGALQDEPDVEPHAFALSPSEAALGETFIASLTVEGPFDLLSIGELEFFGGVEVIATDNRGDELLMTLLVHQDATLGPADLLLRLADGQVELVEGALLVSVDGGSGGNGTDDDTDSGDDGGHDTACD